MTETFTHSGATLHLLRAGNPAAARRLVLLHGWRQPASSLLDVCRTLLPHYEVLGLDTPGNGVAPPPPPSWGIADYTAAAQAALQAEPVKPTIIVCHSFGCRLAMRLAAAAPAWLHGIVVLGGHGLRPQRPWHQQMRVWLIVRITKILGAFDKIFGTLFKKRWAGHFGSADYKAADSALRAVFQRIIADDVAPLLPRITAPALLLYGAHDRETPPAMGRAFHAQLPQSVYVELPHDDHYSILHSAVAATRLKEFVQDKLP